MKINLVLFVFSIVIFIGQKSFAQTPPAITGSIEATYNYSFADTTINALRSYDAHANTILLNNAHIALNGATSKKLSYTAEMDFGTDAMIHGLLNQPTSGPSGPAIGVDIQEAYMTYSFSDIFKFTGGKFVTFEGIEVIEGPSNPTISRGYLYGLAEAYCHVGGYFTYDPSSEIDLKLGVVNGWDRIIDNNKDKTIIGRFGVNLGDPLAFGLSFSEGVEQTGASDARTSIDLTGITKAIPGVALNFQFNYGAETLGTLDASWTGFGLQPVIALSDMVDLGLRLEYFSDEGGSRTGYVDPADPLAKLNVLNFTVVPTFKMDGFVFRVEYRLDSANHEIFPVSEDDPSKTSSTLSLGVSCNF